MRTLIILKSFLVVLLTTTNLSAREPCNRSNLGTFNNKPVWKIGFGVGFISKTLEVDADGAPNSYLVNGKGLSFTCDGSTAYGSTPDTDPDNWQHKCNEAWDFAKKTDNYKNIRIFGFLTDAQNAPIVQKQGDPLPNDAYVSTTSVLVADGPIKAQRHYVDATQIPYVVLSDRFVKKFHVEPGDVAVVYRKSTQKWAFGVYGDGGKLGEASVRLHQDIGNNPIIKFKGINRAKKGIDDETLTIVFPGRNTKPVSDSEAWRQQIESVASSALTQWDGFNQLQACSN